MVRLNLDPRASGVFQGSYVRSDDRDHPFQLIATTRSDRLRPGGHGKRAVVDLLDRALGVRKLAGLCLRLEVDEGLRHTVGLKRSELIEGRIL